MAEITKMTSEVFDLVPGSWYKLHKDPRDANRGWFWNGFPLCEFRNDRVGGTVAEVPFGGLVLYVKIILSGYHYYYLVGYGEIFGIILPEMVTLERVDSADVSG